MTVEPVTVLRIESLTDSQRKGLAGHLGFFIPDRCNTGKSVASQRKF